MTNHARSAVIVLWLSLSLFGEGNGIAQDPEISSRAKQEVTPLMLWYSQPASSWTDALPVGNGRLGAMIFGRPKHDRPQLNEITVWSGGPQPNADRANAYLALPKIRAALASGDYATAQRLVAASMATTGRGDSAYDASYETLGDLTIDSSLGAGPISDYRRWLDLATACLCVLSLQRTARSGETGRTANYLTLLIDRYFCVSVHQIWCGRENVLLKGRQIQRRLVQCVRFRFRATSFIQGPQMSPFSKDPESTSNAVARRDILKGLAVLAMTPIVS